MTTDDVFAFTTDDANEVAGTGALLVVMKGTEIICIFLVPNIAKKRLSWSGAHYYEWGLLDQALCDKIHGFKKERLDRAVRSIWPPEKPISKVLQ